MTAEDHFQIVRRGLALHERFRYAEALPFFERALSMCPGCPVATYDRANTLFMLDEYETAREILLEFVETPEAAHRSACPDAAETPRSLCLDAYHLLFLSTLYATESWKSAAPFLREHLRRRTRGLVSLWSKAQILRGAEELRRDFAPRATSVLEWGVSHR